jgi:hypothetical protein
MMSRVKAAYNCIKASSETDFTEDLKGIDVPTLVVHGDDDQMVPIGASDALEQTGPARALSPAADLARVCRASDTGRGCGQENVTRPSWPRNRFRLRWRWHANDLPTRHPRGVKERYDEVITGDYGVAASFSAL